MTIDSPKGPERTAYSEMLRGMARRVAFYRSRASIEFSSKQRHFTAFNELKRALANAAGFSVREVSQDQLVETMLRRRADNLALRIERDVAKAEVSRLREQLATQELPPNASYRIAAKVMIRLMQAGFPLDNAQRNLLPQIVKDEMRAWAAPVSESVPATPQQDAELMQRIRALVADLQNPCTGTKGEAYDSGFLDGQIQAGNDLEMLLDEADPLRASAPSEASMEVPEAFKDYDLSDVAPGNGFFVERDPSSPPSGGDSDTTPRAWTVGDPEPDESVQAVRAANSQVFRRIWLRSVRHPLWQAGIGVQVEWAVMLGAVGLVTEVLPSPPPSSSVDEGNTQSG